MNRWARGAVIPMVLLFTAGMGGVCAHAHEGVQHAPGKKISTTKPADGAKELMAKRVEKVNERYVTTVKPIFAAKCFDCHASGRELPWYARFPGPKQLIDEDLREAKRHMDMSRDLPFEGHGTLLEDLSAIEKVSQKGSMPPFRYKLLHWRSGLSDEEKKTILNWIAESRALLTTTGAIDVKSNPDKQAQSPCCTLNPVAHQKPLEKK